MSIPTSEEIAIYHKVQRFYNIEDAKGQLEFFLDWMRTDASKDKSLEELMELFDLNELAARFEHCQSCDDAENDTWNYVLNEYIEDHDIYL